MPQTVALLDNTVQVDRQKYKMRRDRIDALLQGFDFTVATSICLLEFKATIIQECITIHDKLRAVGRYTQVRDRLSESAHRQARLRGHIFNNLINVYAESSFEVTDKDDRRLAEKARLRLERVIPRLYKWFTNVSVDAILKDDIQCTRALDPPQKKRVAFGVNLPRCRRGENKFCHVEDFVRKNGEFILGKLGGFLDHHPPEAYPQLRAAEALFRDVMCDPNVELSHNQCRRAGDCLIALEGMEHSTHALSSNAAEWEPICGMLSRQFVRVEFPEEKRI